MSELTIALTIIQLCVSVYLARKWWAALDDLKWKSVVCAHLELERKNMLAEEAQLMQYAHVRAIVANIRSGTARKK